MSRVRKLALEGIRFTLPLLVFLVGVAGFVKLSGSRQAPARAPQEPALPLVETMVVKPHEGGLNFRIDGTVVPAREIQLAAEVDGRVAYKAPECEAGSFVAQGTALYRIDSRDYDLERRRLRQELQQAEVKLGEIDVEIRNTEALIALSRQDLEIRERDLARHERIGGQAVAAAQIDEARRAVIAAQNALQSLENQLHLHKTRRTWHEGAQRLTETQLEKAELDFSRTEIKAPVSGVIIRDQVEQDAYLRRGDPLLTLEDTSSVEVRSSLRMEQLAWLWRQNPSHGLVIPASADDRLPSAESAPRGESGRKYRLPRTPVSVIYELGAVEHVWSGVLDRFDGLGLDERTRTAPVRIVVENPRGGAARRKSDQSPLENAPAPALVRGMVVTIEVHARPQATLVAVPERAIRPGNKIWCVRDGKLSVVDAQVATIVDEQALIDADACPLQVGDLVVTSPLAVPVEGTPVKIASGGASKESDAVPRAVR
jgi:multidrug efflux pump subunit AcrA (membrane-fusion protein)